MSDYQYIVIGRAGWPIYGLKQPESKVVKALKSRLVYHVYII